MNIDEQLEARYEIDFDDYERIHDVHNHDKETDFEDFTVPSEEFVFTGWGRMDERLYDFVE